MSAAGCQSKAQADPVSRQNTNNNGAESATKGAGYENTKFTGTTIGSNKVDGGNPAPTGETNQSGIYTKKNPNPGFEG